MWTKLKLIWQGRKVAANLVDLKSKWKEPTFWLTILSNVGTLIAYLKGVLDPKVAVMLNAGSASLYNYVRGLEKSKQEGLNPFRSSTEFIFGLLTMVNNAFMDIQSHGAATAWMTAANVWIGHAIAANRDLANMEPEETRPSVVAKK